MKRTKTAWQIYNSRWHLLITIFVILVPFLYLLIFARFAHLASTKLFLDVLASLWRMVIAYLIALILAWSFAVLFYRGKGSAVALPIFDVLQSFPNSAALPIATYFWGPSNFTVIFFLTISIIWPIIFSTISSLKLIRRDWYEAVQIYGLRRFDYLKIFLFPASLNGIITGSIIGLGDGWEALAATEIIVQIQRGLGNFFGFFSHNTPMTVFGILGFLVLIFSINKLIWLPLLQWSHEKTEE